MTVKMSGLDELTSKVRGLPTNIVRGVTEWVQQVSNHIAERAEVNAPVLTSRLRANVAVIPVKRTANGAESGVISTALNPRDGKEYAYLMHEFQVPAVGAIWGLGKKTAAQPMTVEGGVGGKYITRVVMFYYGKYEQLLGKAIVQSIHGGPISLGEDLQPSSPATALEGS